MTVLVYLFLLLAIVVILLPPYWPLKKPWGGLQQIKLWTLGVLLLIVLTMQLGSIADRNMPPEITCGNFMLPYLLSLFLLIPALFILCIIMAIIYIYWIVKKPDKDDGEEPQECDQRQTLRTYSTRNVLVIGIFACLTYHLISNQVELSKPAPEWPEWTDDRYNDSNPDIEMDTTADEIDTLLDEEEAETLR